MIVIRNKHIPFKGFSAINLCGAIFIRKDGVKITPRMLRHESIHTHQLLELFIVGFYIWYLTEWVIRWARHKNRYTAYRNICFEREAYENEQNPRYLHERRLWQFRKYLKKNNTINLK